MDEPRDEVFEVLLARMQQGDGRAIEELVRKYEPEIRRFVRFRLSSSALRRVVDSLDVTQSVFANFFVKLNEGGPAPQSREQLVRLLTTMAKNKLYDVARRQQAAKRDVRRINTGEGVLEALADDADSPSQSVAAAELLAMLKSHLSAEEWALVDERLGGRSWAEVAAMRGSTAEAVRKQVTRALDRAAKAMGVVE